MASDALPKAKIAVFISGTGTNMAALLYASKDPACPYEIVLVTGDNPEAPGLNLARAEGVPVIRLPKPTAKDKSQFFQALSQAAQKAGADTIALAGFMRILPESFVSEWQDRVLNIHPSLLPKYKGLHTHARAIEEGDSVAGCTVHVVTPELDSGAILGQTEVAVVPGDTPEILAERVKIAEHQLYPRAVADYVSRGNDPDFLYARVAEIALALPEAHSRDSHGSPGFRVGTEKSGKFFAHFSNQHHGSGHIAVLVKTSGLDEVQGLSETQPDVYCKPAYYGASGWVGVILNRPDVDWEHVGLWLQRSWRSVAPARLTRLLDAADQF
ncbi:MAG: phosphoribosylglycinamide formyltransferase [Pseudomonadota bacterium]